MFRQTTRPLRPTRAPMSSLKCRYKRRVLATSSAVFVMTSSASPRRSWFSTLTYGMLPQISCAEWVAGSKEDFVASAVVPAVHKASNPAKYAMFVVYGLLILVVYFTRDRLLFDPKSWLRQRYAPVAGLTFLHRIPGAIALSVGVLQFSSRLRQRHLQAHRVMGRIYAGCVPIVARL